MATGLVAGMVLAPRTTRITSGVFAAVTIADTLQFVYARAEKLA